MFSRAEVEDSARLKYENEPAPHSRRRPSAIPILVSALQSNEVFEQQEIHDSRTRPIDRKSRPVKREYPFSGPHTSERVRDSEPVEIEKSKSAIFGVEPRRFFIHRNWDFSFYKYATIQAEHLFIYLFHILIVI